MTNTNQSQVIQAATQMIPGIAETFNTYRDLAIWRSCTLYSASKSFERIGDADHAQYLHQMSQIFGVQDCTDDEMAKSFHYLSVIEDAMVKEEIVTTDFDLTMFWMLLAYNASDAVLNAAEAEGEDAQERNQLLEDCVLAVMSEVAA